MTGACGALLQCNATPADAAVCCSSAIPIPIAFAFAFAFAWLLVDQLQLASDPGELAATGIKHRVLGRWRRHLHLPSAHPGSWAGQSLIAILLGGRPNATATFAG